MKGSGPADAPASPRYDGASTFLRLPHGSHLAGVDLAVVGLPFPVGPHAGPRDVRQRSTAIATGYNPGQRVAPFDRLSAVDYGDAQLDAGLGRDALGAIELTIGGILDGGAVPLGIGGDQPALLAMLRAAAKRHGPAALVHFDGHRERWSVAAGADVAHGSVLRHAVAERLVDPARSTLLGMRGGMHDERDDEAARELGFTVIPWDDLAMLGSGAPDAAVERAAGKAVLSFDIDFVDPAFAPGTDFPVCAGPTTTQALALLRACRGLDLGAAVVTQLQLDADVAHLTADLVATVVWEMLTLVACERPLTGIAGASGEGVGGDPQPRGGS